MKAFFKKEILSNPVYIGGTGIRWENIGHDMGIIAIEAEGGVNGLREMVRQQRGGVIEIDEAEYEELKKKAEPDSQPKPRLSEPALDPQPPRVARLNVEPVAEGGRTKPHQPQEPVHKQESQHFKPPLSSAGVDDKGNRPTKTKADKTPIAPSKPHTKGQSPII